MKDLMETVEETVAWMDMVEERIPGIKPMLDEKRREMLDVITEIFQPWVDLADGKITEEEFTEIMDRRQAEELAAREAMWGEPDEDGEWVVECSEEECVRDDLVYEELPPLYPTCEDAEGISCVEDDDEEED